jgi:uncharacterized membrane protein YfcA
LHCFSIPAAYFGGYLQPSTFVLRILIGLVLLFSAVRLIFRRADSAEIVTPSQPMAISVGAGLGFLSGPDGNWRRNISDTTPVFLPMDAHSTAAAVSTLFILVNSIAGLGGYFTKVHSIPSLGFILAGAAIIGGTAGSHLGSRRFAVRVISLF